MRLIILVMLLPRDTAIQGTSYLRREGGERERGGERGGGRGKERERDKFNDFNYREKKF